MAIDSQTSTYTIQRRRGRASGFDPRKLLPWLLVLLFSFFAADLIIIKLRPYMLPKEAPPARGARQNRLQTFDRTGLSTITQRNVFNEGAAIPPALVPAGQERPSEDAAPVPSGLPLTLIGTLVHSNPEKSIATIEVKSKSVTIALRVGKDIPGIATLVRVERNKAIIRNLGNNRLEFIEIKQANKLAFNSARPMTTGSAGGEVKVVGQNRFEVNRADVLKYTSDMASVLQQAAMQPRRNANGEIECFKFLAIQPGSIYTQLGFQVGDCLKGVNGEKIDSPAKAMEMYNALKSSNSIKIQVERDGRDQENDYTVK